MVRGDARSMARVAQSTKHDQHHGPSRPSRWPRHRRAIRFYVLDGGKAVGGPFFTDGGASMFDRHIVAHVVHCLTQ